ncbi:MAG: hypothetical protein ABI292_02740 [Rhodoferax sp.]
MLTVQTAFVLTEADFLRLKGSPPITATLATIVFSGVVGYAISLGPKILLLLKGGEPQFTAGEIYTVGAGVLAAALLYVIGYCWPSDKKKTMKKISEQFSGVAGDHK